MMKRTLLLIILLAISLKAMERKLEQSDEPKTQNLLQEPYGLIISKDIEADIIREVQALEKREDDLLGIILPEADLACITQEVQFIEEKEDLLYDLLLVECASNMRRVLGDLERYYKHQHPFSTPDTIESYIVRLLNNINIEENNKLIDSVLGYHLKEGNWSVALELFKRFGKELTLGKDKRAIIDILYDKLYQADTKHVVRILLLFITRYTGNEIFQRLQDRNNRYREDILTTFARKGKWDIVDYLLNEYGDKIDLYNGFFNDMQPGSLTALHYALKTKQDAIAKKILMKSEEVFKQQDALWQQKTSFINTYEGFKMGIFHEIIKRNPIPLDLLTSLPPSFNSVITVGTILKLNMDGNRDAALYLDKRLKQHEAMGQLFQSFKSQ